MDHAAPPATTSGDLDPTDALFLKAWIQAHPSLFRRAERLTRGDSHTAQDRLSQTALKALPAFRRSPEIIRNPEGFLFLVLEHVHVDALRRESREKRIFDNSASDRIETCQAPTSLNDQLENRDMIGQIGRQLSTLSETQQRLFNLMFLLERPYSEIADEFKITQALVRKRVQLLRTKLSLAVGHSQNRSRNVRRDECSC